MPESRRLDGYIRVSATADREGDAFQSPLQQRQAIERWAAAHGVEIAAWHKDIDATGARMSRPGLEAILARVRAGSSGGVVVAWLDRFSRASVRDALGVVEEIRSHGASVVALDFAGLDPDDPFGEYALTTMLALSRMQLRRIAESWASARRNAIARGVHTAPAPYGYRRGADGRLVVVDGEADVVRRLYQQRARGRTPLELARWLDEVAPRSGGRLWSRNTVRTMTANPTYLGGVRDGSFVNERAHEPIVERALWRSAQREPGVHPGRNPRMVLARIVRCASCGHLMKGSVQNATHRHIYRCSERFVSGMCPRPLSVSEAPLEREVVKQLIEHLEQRRDADADWRAEIATAGSEVEHARQAVALYLELTPSSRTGLDAHRAGLAAREGELATAEERLQRLLDAEQWSGEDPDALRRSWPTLAPERKRAILRDSLDAIMVRAARSRSRHNPMAERLLVLFRGEAAAELRGVTRVTRTWTWDAQARLRSEPPDPVAIERRAAARDRHRAARPAPSSDRAGTLM